MIKAPMNLILKDGNKDHEVVLLKALEFLKTMIQGYEFDFLLGGMRDQGYGRATILPMTPKKNKKSKSKTLIPLDAAKESTEENGNLTNQFKLKKTDALKLDSDFLAIVEKEKTRFPIKNKMEDSQEEKLEANA